MATPAPTTSTPAPAASKSSDSQSDGIRPPYFNGSEDAFTWYKQFEKYVEYRHITEEERIRALFLVLLRGQSAEWCDSIPDRQKATWDALRQSFHSRYIITEATKLKSTRELFSLRQQEGECTDDYIVKMRKLASFIQVEDALLLNAVINGLRPNLSAIILIQKPKTLEELLTAARIAEVTLKPSIDETLICKQLQEMQVEMRRMGGRLDRVSSTNIQRSASSSPARKVQFKEEFPRQRQQPDQSRERQQQQQSGQRGHTFYRQGAPQPVQRSNTPQWSQRQGVNRQQSSCSRCGYLRCFEGNNNCVALNKQCHKCFSYGHLQHKCLKANRQQFQPAQRQFYH
jgi:hypothetical protein